MTGPFLDENARSSERLRSLVSQLTDEELDYSADGDWTVAAVLAHVAFWDQRACSLLRRWKRNGVSPSPIDVDNVNETLLPILLALPPRRAAELASAAAEAADQELASASPELIAAIEGQGRFRLRRSEHRLEHLEQIERSLKTRPKE